MLREYATAHICVYQNLLNTHLLTVVHSGYASGRKRVSIKWAKLCSDPSAWILPECYPDDFPWADPSKIHITDVFRLLAHWRLCEQDGLTPLIWNPTCELLMGIHCVLEALELQKGRKYSHLLTPALLSVMGHHPLTRAPKMMKRRRISLLTLRISMIANLVVHHCHCPIPGIENQVPSTFKQLEEPQKMGRHLLLSFASVIVSLPLCRSVSCLLIMCTVDLSPELSSAASPSSRALQSEAADQPSKHIEIQSEQILIVGPFH
jgi:hypothetical protein